jgi:hypothetical protein
LPGRVHAVFVVFVHGGAGFLSEGRFRYPRRTA